MQRPPFPAGTEVPVVLSGISTPFGELFRTSGQITHVLRTRAPLYSPLRAFSLDLHVLGTPPAFVLSQDQTLQLRVFGSDAVAPCEAGRHRCFVCIAFSRNAGPHSLVACYSVFKDRAPSPDTEPSSVSSLECLVGVASTTGLRQGRAAYLHQPPRRVKRSSPAFSARWRRPRQRRWILIPSSAPRQDRPQTAIGTAPSKGRDF